MRDRDEVSEIVRFNKDCWEALSESGVEYARPWLDLDAAAARGRVDPHDLMGEVRGRRVLCLAASGGQQSAAFLILGASVTVFDLSENQLEKDRRTAAHYGGKVETVSGDMQDLGVFRDESFSVVWLAHGINFVPSARCVLREAARVLEPSGTLRVECTNPFGHGIDEHFSGTGYEVRQPFIDGAEVAFDSKVWEFTGDDGQPKRVEGPHEFRHSLSTIVNTCIESSLAVLGLWENDIGDPDAEPGSWGHFTARMPPWIELWLRKA
mgnify:CR=1 FL=1